MTQAIVSISVHIFIIYVNWFSGFQSEISIVNDVLIDWFSLMYSVHCLRPADLRHIESGKMLHTTGSRCFGVDFTVLEMILKKWLSKKTILLQRELLNNTGQAYFMFQYTSASTDVHIVKVDGPQDEPTSFCAMFFLVLSLAAVFSIHRLYISCLSRVTLNCLGV